MRRLLNKHSKFAKFIRFQSDKGGPKDPNLSNNSNTTQEYSPTLDEKAIISEFEKNQEQLNDPNLTQKPIETPKPVKTAQELQAEVEAAERLLKEQQELEVLLRKTIYRGIRATVLAVFAFALFFFVLSKKGKESKFLKFVEEKFGKKNESEEKSIELIKEMKEGGYPVDEKVEIKK